MGFYGSEGMAKYFIAGLLTTKKSNLKQINMMIVVYNYLSLTFCVYINAMETRYWYMICLRPFEIKTTWACQVHS